MRRPSDDEEAFPFEITDDGDGRFELVTHGDIFEEAQPSGDEMEMFSPAMLEGLFDVQLRVHLPGEVVSTNADETTEEGVMVWGIDPLAEEQIHPAAVTQVSGQSSAVLLVVIAALVVAAAATAVAWLRRRPGDEPEPVTVGTAAPEEPV